MLKVTIEVDASNRHETSEKDDLSRTVKLTAVHTFYLEDSSGMGELDAARQIENFLQGIKL